jgi:hypothetical protein
MSYNFTLNSSNVIGNNNSQFKYDLVQGALDVPDNAEIQLSQLNYPYSMQNITSKIGNNTFSYTAPLETTNITINGYLPVDTANKNAMVTTTSGITTNTVTVSGVGYVNNSNTMALNIVGATGFTGNLLITAVSAQSGTVTITLNQTCTFSLGAVCFLYYVNATTIALDINGAGNYVVAGYVYFNGSLAGTNFFIQTASANSGNSVIVTVDKLITSSNTGLGSINGKIVPYYNLFNSPAVFTFIGEFTNNPVGTSAYILSSSWAGIYTGYGSPTTNTLYNISLISGNYYQASINSVIVGLIDANITTSYSYSYYPITISDGFYTIDDLNNYFKTIFFNNGHFWYDSKPLTVTGTLGAIVGTVGLGGVSTLTIVGPAIRQMALGSSVYGTYNGTDKNVFFGTLGAQLTQTTYSIISAFSNVAISTDQQFFIANNNESIIDQTASGTIYPIELSTNTSGYGYKIKFNATPAINYIQNVYGSSYQLSNNWDGSRPWLGGSPQINDPNLYFQLIIPTTTKFTSTIGNFLGFTGGIYPTSNIPSPTTAKFLYLTSNSLTASPSFVPLGSYINSIVVHCNLVDNKISMPSDILCIIPINSTYGSNINFLNPNKSTFMKLKKGRHSNIIIYLTDQNNNPIIGLDPNCLISLIIKFNK